MFSIRSYLIHPHHLSFAPKIKGFAKKLIESVNRAEEIEVVIQSINPFGLRADSRRHMPALHSLSFKRNMREISELYGTESSLDAVEEYRRSSGLEAISSKCFKAAGFSAVLIDDGLKLDKKHDIECHKDYFPFVGRILRIERLAEEILDGIYDGETY